MFCKYCGMESSTQDRCSWCHKVLAPASSPVAPAPPAAPIAKQVVTPEPPAELTATAEMPAIAEPVISETVETPSHTPPARPAAPQARPAIGVRRAGTARPDAPTPDSTTPPAPAKPAEIPVAPVAQAPVAVPMAPNRPQAPSSRPTAPPSAPVMAPASSAIMRSGTAETTAPIPLTNPHPPVSTPIQPKRPTAPTAKPAAPVVPASMTTSATPTSEGLAAGIARPTRPAPQVHTPELSSVTAVKSKYYQDVVVDPVSGTHYDLMTSKPMATSANGAGEATLAPERELIVHYIDEDDAENNNVLKYSIAFLGILLITYYIVALVPPLYWLPLMLCNFAGGMLLPVLKVGPWQDEDADDIGWLFLGTLILGPIVSLILYGAASLIRKEHNPTVLGCFVISALSRITVEIAAGYPTLNYIFVPWGNTGVNVTLFAVSWAGLVTMLGWIMANVFHKLDE